MKIEEETLAEEGTPVPHVKHRRENDRRLPRLASAR